MDSHDKDWSKPMDFHKLMESLQRNRDRTVINASYVTTFYANLSITCTLNISSLCYARTASISIRKTQSFHQGMNSTHNCWDG